MGVDTSRWRGYAFRDDRRRVPTDSRGRAGRVRGASDRAGVAGAGDWGSTAAFEQVLGGPNDASLGAQLHYQRCAGTDVDQFVVLAPNDQVWTIQRAWCDLASVPADQRFADAARFLPPDAEPGRRTSPSRASRR